MQPLREAQIEVPVLGVEFSMNLAAGSAVSHNLIGLLRSQAILLSSNTRVTVLVGGDHVINHRDDVLSLNSPYMTTCNSCFHLT